MPKIPATRNEFAEFIAGLFDAIEDKGLVWLSMPSALGLPPSPEDVRNRAYNDGIEAAEDAVANYLRRLGFKVDRQKEA